MARPKKTGPVQPISTAKKHRKLYKIAQTMRLLGITGRTIRYYDQLGLLPHIKRSDGGVRLFDESDIELIKKIRTLQTEKSMSLVAIKEFLFAKDPEDYAFKSVVLTDEIASLPEGLCKSFDISVIRSSISPPIASPSVKTFVDCFQTFSQKGFKRIYAPLSSSTLSETVSCAMQAANKVKATIDVVVIDSKSYGAGVGLLALSIAKAIQNKETSAEIQLLITKQVPMIYELAIGNSLNHLVSGGILNMPNTATTRKDQQELMEKIFGFKPVISIKNATGEVEVVHLCKTKEDSILMMVGLLENEVAMRGGYMNGMIIHHHNMLEDATKLMKTVQNNYPNAPIYLIKEKSLLSTYLGPEMIGIGII